MLELPIDIVFQILNFLKNHHQFRLISRSFRDLIDDPKNADRLTYQIEDFRGELPSYLLNQKLSSCRYGELLYFHQPRLIEKGFQFLELNFTKCVKGKRFFEIDLWQLRNCKAVSICQAESVICTGPKVAFESLSLSECKVWNPDDLTEVKSLILWNQKKMPENISSLFHLPKIEFHDCEFGMDCSQFTGEISWERCGFFYFGVNRFYWRHYYVPREELENYVERLNINWDTDFPGGLDLTGTKVRNLDIRTKHLPITGLRNIESLGIFFIMPNDVDHSIDCSNMENLKFLSLEGLTDCEIFSGKVFPKLERLLIRKVQNFALEAFVNGLRTVDGVIFRDYSNIREVQIDHFSECDFSCLVNCRSLTLYCGKVTGLPSNLPILRLNQVQLELENQDCWDFQPELTHLSIINTNVDRLPQSNKFRIVSLDSTQISDISSLTDLNHLVIRECPIVDLSSLKRVNLLRLEYLKIERIGQILVNDLSITKVTNLDLTLFKQVKKLRLSRVEIPDLSNYPDLESLTIDCCWGNRTIPALKIKKLLLRSNGETFDISACQKHLISLRCFNSLIQDRQWLKNLRFFSCSGTVIPDPAVVSGIPFISIINDPRKSLFDGMAEHYQISFF